MTHEERVHELMYSCDSRTELCERIAALEELARDYHTFLALAGLAQPIGYIIAAHGHPTLSVETLDERYRELGVEMD